MLEPIIILETLEENFAQLQTILGPEAWNGFCSRVGVLAAQFEAVSAEADEDAAATNLEFAVNELLRICLDYDGVAEVMGRAVESGPQEQPPGDGTRQPPAPLKAPRYNPRELANKYYSLLVKMETGKGAKPGKSGKTGKAGK